MEKRGGIKYCIAMLIGLLAVGILSHFLPHHHHEGKICVETSEDIPHEERSSDNCLLETTNLEYKQISEASCNTVPLPLSFILSSLSFSLYEDVAWLPSDADPRPESPCSPYSVRPHKLRGSPLFS